jgi:beta-glucosidase-like glycosyl hydrolase
MSLDGLRAWIGVVERKLTMRTRVFLVLVAIAIGGAAAGIVLAINAQDNSVSKDDLQSVRDELTGASAPAEAPQTSELEAQIETLRGEIDALRSESEAGGGASSEGAEGPPASGSGGASAPENQQQLKEAAEEALEKSHDKDK